MNFRRLLAILSFMLVFYYSFKVGTAHQGRVDTDSYSETQAVADAKNIAAGRHRFGIVKYAHYPNGPSYILLPAIWTGHETPKELRVVPVIFSAVCLGILAIGLVLFSQACVLTPVAIAGCFLLLWQPGVFEWMGALHEHSYALGMCFATAGFSLVYATPRWLLLLSGLIAGWMGYDMLLVMLGGVFSCRLLALSKQYRNITSAILGSFIDLSWTIVGVALAVILHLTQNSLYFGSWHLAFHDLIGSAAVRAGLEIGAELNPEYNNWIKQVSNSEVVNRLDLIKQHFNDFSGPKWINKQYAALAFFGIVGMIALLSACMVICFKRRLAILNSKAITFVAAIFGSLLSSVLWIILMPDHARFHFHFLPRHFIVPFLLIWITLYAIADDTIRALLRLLSKGPNETGLRVRSLQDCASSDEVADGDPDCVHLAAEFRISPSK